MNNFLLTTPTSHLFEDELNASSIISVSDGLELRESMFLKYQLHGWTKVRLAHLDRIDLTHPWSQNRRDMILKMVSALPELELATFHVSCNCDAPEIRDKMYYPGGRVFSRDEMKNYAQENIQWFRNAVGMELQIALENNNYYPTPAYDVVTDADFLSTLVEENNIRFLFDIAHAHVTAHNRKFGFGQYIENLPLDRVIQVHLCKHRILENGKAFDEHEIPDTPLIEYAFELAEKFPVKYLTIEYYRDVDRLVNVLKYIRSKFQ